MSVESLATAIVDSSDLRATIDQMREEFSPGSGAIDDGDWNTAKKNFVEIIEAVISTAAFELVKSALEQIESNRAGTVNDIVNTLNTIMAQVDTNREQINAFHGSGGNPEPAGPSGWEPPINNVAQSGTFGAVLTELGA